MFQAAWHLPAALLKSTCPNAPGRRSGPSSDPGIGGLSGNQTTTAGCGGGLVDFLPSWALCCSPHPLSPRHSSLPTWDHLAHLLFTLPLCFGSTSHIRDPPKFSSNPDSRSASVWVSREVWKAGQSSVHPLPQVLIPGQFLTCAFAVCFPFAYPKSILHSSCSEPRANSYGMPQPGC